MPIRFEVIPLLLCAAEAGRRHPDAARNARRAALTPLLSGHWGLGSAILSSAGGALIFSTATVQGPERACYSAMQCTTRMHVGVNLNRKQEEHGLTSKKRLEHAGDVLLTGLSMPQSLLIPVSGWQLVAGCGDLRLGQN